MKTANILISTLILGLFGLTGCGGAKSNSTSADSQVTTVPTDVISVINQNGQSGTLNTTGSSITISLRGLHPDLAAQYSKLDMELDLGTVIGNHTDLDANQGGDLTIHKTFLNGSKGYSFFTSGGNVKDDVKENYWYYNSSGKLVWRGAFEGPTGTLVVVVDGVYQSGDGNDPFDYMSGSVWFRPWPSVADTGINSNKCVIKDGRIDCKNPSGPLTRCWNVSLGPYDCRFTVSADSQTVTAVGNAYTDEPYVKIADFIDLSRDKTFKETY